MHKLNLLHLFGVLFVGLKLTGQIDWSWWWVLLPLYGPYCAIAVVLLSTLFVVIGVGGACALLGLREAIKEKKP